MRTPILDDEEMLTLHRLLEALIPTDQHAGAREAQVDVFILQLLTTDAGLGDIYRAGLRTWMGVDADRLESELIRREGESFVRLLVQHALEGFYGDPGQGGNRNGVSWEMVGFRVTA